MKIKLDEKAIMPVRAHDTDAGLDLFSPEDVTILAGGYATIDTGVHVEIPNGYVGLLTSKSGLMRRLGITNRWTIDCGYTGSMGAVLFNHGSEDYHIKRGDRITQLVIIPCLTPELELVDDLDETERGAGGFGSTGR